MASEQLIHLKPAAQSRTPLGLALESFLLDAEARRLTPASLRFYRQQLGPFLDFLSGQQVSKPEAVTPHHIRSYLVGLERRGLSDSSQHGAARSIRAFCNFLVREELLTASPMRRVQMPRQEKTILPAFTPEEARAIHTACDCERDRAIVLTLLDTGCRASEFVALDVGDVDMATGKVWVRRGKGRKQRYVFLGARARKTLIKHLMERSNTADGEPLWISQHGGARLTIWGLALVLRRLGERSGVDHCHAHTFRRTFALWSLRSGMNLMALQQLMGHSDLAMLRRYLALVDEDLADAHRKHGAVDTMF